MHRAFTGQMGVCGVVMENPMEFQVEHEIEIITYRVTKGL